MSTDSRKLEHEMAKGAAWTVCLRLADRGIGLLSTAVLARILLPTDFGLIALALTLQGVLNTTTQFSFDVFLIYNQKASKRHYDTAWTLSIIRNATLAGITAFLAAPMASLFREPRLEEIAYCLAFATAIEGFQNIGTVNFQKDLAFRREFVFVITAKLGMLAVTLPVAILWRNYWALILGILAWTFFKVILSYVMSNHRPTCTLAMWREVTRFSKWLVLRNAVAVIYSSSSTLIIGRTLGAQAVGYYSLAFQIANLPMSELITPIRRVLIPGFARIASDPDGLRKAFVEIFAISMLLVAPIAAIVGLTADPLVLVVLGPNWKNSIPLVQVFAVHAFLSVTAVASGPVYLTLGKPHLNMGVVGCVSLLMIPALFLIVTHYGLYGAAVGVTAGTAAIAATDLFVVVRLLRLSIRRLVSVSWRSAFSMVGMAAAIIQARALWSHGHINTTSDVALELTTAVAAGTVVYVALQWLQWWLSGFPEGSERRLLLMVRHAVGRKGVRRAQLGS